MKIRRAKPSDAPAVKLAHYHAYQTSYRGYLPDDFLNAMPFNQDVIDKTAENIRKNEYYVAEEDGHVLGFAMLTYPEPATVEIQALYVHPDFQRRGVGRRLVQTICRRKKKAGFRHSCLWTIKNGPSLGFYYKMGFQSSAVPREKLWKLNIPIIRLGKEL